MNIDVNWFQGRIRDLGTSQRQISAAIATNPNTLSLILNGKRRVSHEEIPMLARILETSAEEILKRLGVEEPATAKSNAVECVGSVDETGHVTLGRTRTVSPPANANGSTRAVIFDSVGAQAFQHGWIYYFDEPAKAKPVDADSLNSLCFVEVGDKDGYHLGVVTRGLERGRFDLVSPFTGDRIVGGIAIRSAVPVTWISTASN